ncbi:dephospho-CoA kinase [Martelella mediterranea]|uniref:dephospho-CoA kinase n=1 Tax=Martelella mediterranea TaxID=293089 RepID=UPI001E3A58FA|nr:dephospho-CoA kinase [Martelella mediterranea]MCD1636252.1 dephospho-CoA kinase [Martelella mediterranea]
MIVLGLTGSIGMGKSTTAGFFAEAGMPVFNADDAVHRLYRGRAVEPVEAVFPGVAVNGAIDRQKLSKALAGKAENFKRLEAIVHPLVREERRAFLEQAQADGAPIAVLDIPLLYETGGERDVDYVVVVTCDPEIQRERVLSRPEMTVEKLETVLKQQLPDGEKRARADYIVDTGNGMDAARTAVGAIIADLKTRGPRATTDSTRDNI